MKRLRHLFEQLNEDICSIQSGNPKIKRGYGCGWRDQAKRTHGHEQVCGYYGEGEYKWINGHGKMHKTKQAIEVEGFGKI